MTDSGEIDDRWGPYLDNTVVVVLGGTPVDLTGPDAVEEWPFDGPVHGLTGWDPSGRAMERHENDAANDALRQDLIDAGGTVSDSAGHGGPVCDETFIDRGFIVAGLDESTVVELALRYDQEAIYELADDHLTVIATREDRRESRPRRSLRR